LVEKPLVNQLESLLKERILDAYWNGGYTFLLPKNKTARLATSYMAYEEKPLEKIFQTLAWELGKAIMLTGTSEKAFLGGAGPTFYGYGPMARFLTDDVKWR